MKISILTVFSSLYEPFLNTSLLKRARENNLVQFDMQDFFSFTEPKKRIDASTIGPGSGMLIKPEVVQKAIEHQEKKHGKAFKIFFSPQGKKLDQRLLEKIAKKAQGKKHLMLVPARYEGMDARVEQEYADELVSVGDFVLMGGDIPAMMLLEGVLRLFPGVVGKKESVQEESFSGPFVDYPEYTHPIEWQGKKVPDIVRSGNHEAIKQWRLDKAAQKTMQQHFNWLRTEQLTNEEKQRAKKYMPSHYVALLHGDVLVGPEKKLGVTSVTSVDIHDIARSCATYDVKGFFLVTPLQDQQTIVNTLQKFWMTDVGIAYNSHRHEAMRRLMVMNNLQEAIDEIKQKEGKHPVVVVTSARNLDHKSPITFFDQDKVWKHDRPVLIVLGTGQGLSGEIIEKSDYLLTPLQGLTEFKHLSVRSAAAIILDRWLGVNPKYTAKRLAD